MESLMNTPVYDAILIGGGLAGACAGFHLASYGYSVLLLEKSKKPHHKICGEFLSAETIPYLKEMGIDLDELQAPHIRKFSFYSKHFQTQNDFPQAARALSRYVLDELCLKKAEQAGCEIRRGQEVLHYEKG